MNDEQTTEVEAQAADAGLSRVVVATRIRAGLLGPGRPVTGTSAKRYVNVRREHAQMRLWKKAGDVVAYVCRVALGHEQYDEGRLKAAALILNRTLPTITAQQVDSTTVSATVPTGNLEAVSRRLLEEIERRELEAVNGGR